MLYHKIQRLLAEGHKWDEMLYLSFEDERLAGAIDVIPVWKWLLK